MQENYKGKIESIVQRIKETRSSYEWSANRKLGLPDIELNRVALEHGVYHLAVRPVVYTRGAPQYVHMFFQNHGISDRDIKERMREASAAILYNGGDVISGQYEIHFSIPVADKQDEHFLEGISVFLSNRECLSAIGGDIEAPVIEIELPLKADTLALYAADWIHDSLFRHQ